MIGRKLLFVLLLVAFATMAVAQEAPASASTRDQAKKQKSKNGAGVRDSAEFSEAVAIDVLGQIRDGLEGHSQRLMLAAFNSDRFEGYMTFEDQIQQYFEKFEGFRAHFRIIQTSIEGPKGVVLAEFDVEGMPRSGGAAQRRSNQLRFEMERGKKGWQVVDMRPRAFFS